MSDAQFESYNGIRVTARDAEFLADCHGYANVGALAVDLPPSAKVIDVGAGISKLGLEITGIRPDIAWTNIDQAYENDDLIKNQLTEARTNLSFVAARAQDLNMLAPNSIDMVFSYWCLPHILMNDPEQARIAVKRMYAVTKIGGRLSIGPLARNLRPRRTIIATKSANAEADTFADSVLTDIHKIFRFS